MTVLKSYVLKLFLSLKYITENVVERNNGRIVVSALENRVMEMPSKRN